MEEQELYKYFVKTKVIFKIALLYFPAVVFTLYFDALISALILRIDDLYGFVHLFSYPWLKILSILLIQYMVCCFFAGLFIGLKRAISRNKDFFFS
jgi:hypothetical protein